MDKLKTALISAAHGLKFKAPMAAVTGGFAYLVGGWDKIMEILLILIIADYLTGVGVAFKDKKVNSEIGFMGLIKKATIFLVLILAAQLDRVVDNSGNVFRSAAALFYIANEGFSIAENIGKIGLPLPEFLTKTLVQLQNKGDDIDG